MRRQCDSTELRCGAKQQPSQSGNDSTLNCCSCFAICISANCFSLKSAPSLFSAALQALKRKKRYEKQLAQIDGTLSTIEFQRDALENANTNTEVLKNIGYAAKAMKNAHENL